MDDEPAPVDGSAADALRVVLGERLYEYNVEATGIADGRELTFVHRNEAGELVAGLAGHTWGGYAEVQYLWVSADARGSGLGSRLLRAAEDEARRRGCAKLVLSTHSFQAPAFYARHGYVRILELQDQPRGHSSILLTKALR